MDLNDLNQINKASSSARKDLIRLSLGLAFILLVVLYLISKEHVEGHLMLVIAAVFGSYMALNIGANDVANNVGPAVGSKALTMTGAIAIAAIFEASGTLIAGGDVVTTIKDGIINPQLIRDSDTFIWLMMAALLAA
ncbi:MAG: inorganic phosphate transporter, partial [Methylomicrobium sp.]|nr:inorganic phosphate transporter [Methylomicrobium sp.]